MCGLAFAFSKKGSPAGQQIIKLYNKQEHRGKQGYGFLAIQDGVLVDVKRAKTEGIIKSYLHKSRASFVMFHHRAPTSTKNTIGTTHPMFVSHKELKYDYYFAHNGVIYNAAHLKKQHNDLGYEYTTEMVERTYAVHKNGSAEEMASLVPVFNDSETLAIELARFIEGLQERVDARGGSAFWGISLEKGTSNVVEVFFGKNMGRDLGIFENKKWWGVASETGDDIRDMELFSFKLSDPNHALSSRPLLMDDAKPVVKPPEIENKNEIMIDARTPEFDTRQMGFSDDDRDYGQEQQYNYDNLVNAYYTLSEIGKTGMPFSEFTKVAFDPAVGMNPNHIYFVPTKFLGKGFNSRVLKTAYVELPTPEPSTKELELLEKYAAEHAKHQAVLDFWNNEIQKRSIGYNMYKEATDAAQERVDDVLVKIALLNIDSDTVDEYLDMALEMEQDQIYEAQLLQLGDTPSINK